MHGQTRSNGAPRPNLRRADLRFIESPHRLAMEQVAARLFAQDALRNVRRQRRALYNGAFILGAVLGLVLYLLIHAWQ